MADTSVHRRSPEAKIGPLLAALEACYGRPVRPRRDPLEVLIRGVLSQNTNDRNSGRAYENLVRTFGSWARMAAARRAEVERAIRVGGLPAQKAAAIQAALRWLRGRGGYSLEFLRDLPPAEAERQLTALKGVGIKTARLVLLFGFGRPLFVVDTHVHRVAQRLALIPPKCSREKAHALLDALVPDADKYSAHMNLIAHGRQICHARKPQCERCPVRRWCGYAGTAVSSKQ